MTVTARPRKIRSEKIFVLIQTGYWIVNTCVRITEDMVDAMGGKQSKTFESFVQRTQKGYEAMRLHSDFWYHLLVSEFYIFQDARRHKKRIRDHILDRFVPGEWSSEASMHIQTIVHSA